MPDDSYFATDSVETACQVAAGWTHQRLAEFARDVIECYATVGSGADMVSNLQLVLERHGLAAHLVETA